MADLFAQLSQLLGNQTSTDELSRTVGAQPSNVQGALMAALPLLLSGLAHNAQQPGGSDALLSALQRHDGTALDDPTSLLRSQPTTDGEKIVGHVFGDRTTQAKDAVAKAGAIDPATAMKILAVAAPFVMAALAKKKNEQNLDANGLSQYLGGQQQTLQAAQPGLMGMASRLLDRNGDGNITDDVAGIVGKLFGG
jgi:hypothetical protein